MKRHSTPPGRTHEYLSTTDYVFDTVLGTIQNAENTCPLHSKDGEPG